MPPITLYDATIPIFTLMLKNLSAILGKAEAHVKEHNLAESELTTEARLAPDMQPLPFQIYTATDTAKNAIARLSPGVAGQIPKFDDTEKTLAQLRERLDKTVRLLESIKREDIDGREDAEISMSPGGKELKFSGLTYVQAFALPNFLFHIVTAYDILRHKGVQIGKVDFLRGGAKSA